MKILKKDKSFYFPPLKKGHISWMYPWHCWKQDHIIVLRYMLKKMLFLPTPGDLGILEKEIANLLGCDQIFFVDSGRGALVVALQGLGVERGDEVLMSSFNCPAVAEAVYSVGAVPKFVDVNTDGGVNLESVGQALNSKTKALIITHIYGYIEDLSSIEKFCRKNNLNLINDLAQTFENLESNERKHNYGDVSIYSFGPEKHIFALGGGAIVSHNKKLVASIENHYPHTTVHFSEILGILIGRWRYYFTFYIYTQIPRLVSILASLNLILRFKQIKLEEDINKTDKITPKRMNYLQLTVLESKLINYKTVSAISRNNFKHLASLLSDKVSLRSIKKEDLPLYATLHVNKEDRYPLAEYLAWKGVQTVWNYFPLYHYLAYSGCPVVGKKSVEKLWREVLSVPFKYPLETNRIQYIARCINEYYQK